MVCIGYCSGRISIRLFSALVVLFVVSSLPLPALSQECELEENKFTPSDSSFSNDFGFALAGEGDLLVVGAHAANGQQGKVYVLRSEGSGWIEEGVLTASDGAPADHFGYSVDVSGDTIVVGAQHNDSIEPNSNSGAAYVFRKTGANWVEEAKLVPDDIASTDKFGYSVGVSGGSIVIGSPGNDEQAGQAGAVYVFSSNGPTWVQQQKLFASDGVGQDEFGISLSIEGDRVVVGAHTHRHNGEWLGAAYVFRKIGSTWAEEQKLLAEDAFPYDKFGRAVSIYGDLIAIGTPDDDDNGESSGSAYLFRLSDTTWTQEAKLLADDGYKFDSLGTSVSVRADSVIVGAKDAGIGGGAYLYSQAPDGSWLQTEKLKASDEYVNDRYGTSVYLTSTTAVVGSPNDDDNGISSGAIYYYHLTCETAECSVDADCADTNACTAEACIEGMCISTPLTCNDQNSCTVDSCDPSTGCVHQVLDCNDGNACTADACSNGQCVNEFICECQTHEECDDGSICTLDSCQAGSCVNTAINCDDQDSCTVDGCHPILGCSYEVIDCNDGDSCTLDSCSNGQCQNEFVCECQAHQDCDDGSVCTLDSCQGGSCVNVSINCDDQDSCTVDGCHPITGCTNEPIDCNDGDSCTADSCSGGQCLNEFICECQLDSDCDDSNSCTQDSCVAGHCKYQEACQCQYGLECSDGDACTIDICSDGECSSVPMDCDDGDPCTEDFCEQGYCRHEKSCSEEPTLSPNPTLPPTELPDEQELPPDVSEPEGLEQAVMEIIELLELLHESRKELNKVTRDNIQLVLSNNLSALDRARTSELYTRRERKRISRSARRLAKFLALRESSLRAQFHRLKRTTRTLHRLAHTLRRGSSV